MLSKIKNSRLFKYLSVACVTGLIAVFGCLSVFAEEASAPDLKETVRSSFSNVNNDLFTYISIVLPIALTVFATVFCVQWAIKFFKKIAK